jgi:hypothetical protein
MMWERPSNQWKNKYLIVGRQRDFGGMRLPTWDPV